MVTVHQDVQKMQEVRNFLGKHGKGHIFTEEEKIRFEGTLFLNGQPNLSFLSFISSSAVPH